ncbi:hypothetical protein LJC15_03945 [Desulfovibrio sp. OttesenSCG-928-G11]|nr:hypothetical protein [Desulfovibrio sp. OttesenSCG-928-G11]
MSGREGKRWTEQEEAYIISYHLSHIKIYVQGDAMFLVTDDREERSKKIREFIDIDVEVAVLVAAADFEWTCRRCILALGTSPTKYIRNNVLKGKTFTKYPQIWKQEVYPMYLISIEDLLPNFSFKGNAAFDLRNQIIHGEVGKVKFENGKETVEEILSATERLTDFAEEKGYPINRMIRRYNKRTPLLQTK